MKIDPAIRKALDDTGLPWTVEPGSKHVKIRVGGRLAAILSHGRSGVMDRELKNTIAQIRRVAKGQP